MGRVILFSLVLTLIVVILAVVLPNILASRLVQSAGQAIGFYLVMFLLYLVSIWFTVYLQQYEDAQVTNYSFESSRLGNVHFHSTLKARELTNLVLGNVLAVAFTLGMLYPWARVRYNRYLLEHLTVSTPDDMDQYMADKANDESAIGDSAIDMLDLDIGL